MTVTLIYFWAYSDQFEFPAFVRAGNPDGHRYDYVMPLPCLPSRLDPFYLQSDDLHRVPATLNYYSRVVCALDFHCSAFDEAAG